MASSKPKHVAMFCLIVHITKLCLTKIVLLLNMYKNLSYIKEFKFPLCLYDNCTTE